MNHTGGVGATVTISATVVHWATVADPILHAIATCVAIVAGGLTILWYWKQLRKKD